MSIENPKVVPAPMIPPPAISGDIFPSQLGGDHQEPQTPPPVETPPPAAATQKVVIGDKVFNNEAEALKYFEGAEDARKRAMATMAPRVEETPSVQPKKLGQLIFEDPDQAFAQAKAEIKQEIRAEQRNSDEKRNFWEDFYLKHPDLVGSELLVDAVLGKEQSQGRFNVSWNQAYEQAPILAAKARQEVSKIRNAPSGGQALPSNPAMVAGSSGASTPRPQAAPPVKTDFISELKGMRKRG